MIVPGYYGELVVTGDLTPRGVCWFAFMAFFLCIVYEMLVSLAAATVSEVDPVSPLWFTADHWRAWRLPKLSCFPGVSKAPPHHRLGEKATQTLLARKRAVIVRRGIMKHDRRGT